MSEDDHNSIGGHATAYIRGTHKRLVPSIVIFLLLLYFSICARALFYLHMVPSCCYPSLVFFHALSLSLSPCPRTPFSFFSSAAEAHATVHRYVCAQGGDRKRILTRRLRTRTRRKRNEFGRGGCREGKQREGRRAGWSWGSRRPLLSAGSACFSPKNFPVRFQPATYVFSTGHPRQLISQNRWIE